jgi:hypothetical protein
VPYLIRFPLGIKLIFGKTNHMSSKSELFHSLRKLFLERIFKNNFYFGDRFIKTNSVTAFIMHNSFLCSDQIRASLTLYAFLGMEDIHKNRISFQCLVAYELLRRQKYVRY